MQQIAFLFVLPILTLAVAISFVRLVRGPSLPDRVVALDLITTMGIGIIAAYAITADQAIYLDVVIILALVSFLGTIAFAYYVEKRAGQ